MKLLESYILRRVGQMFLVALLPVLAIIWTTQVLQRINLVTDSGQSIGSFMKLATLILPTILPIVLPFAIVIGITQTLTAMNNDSELTVIDAAGAARSLIFRPILLLAAFLSIFSFTVDNFVEPKVRVAVREMVAAAYADLLSSVIEEKTFRKIEDGLYVQISERLQGRVLRGLFVADSRDPNFDLIYYAREGAVDAKGTSLIMRDGEVQRKMTNGGNVSIIKFDSYSFDLSDLTQTRGQATLRANDRSLGFLWNPDPNDSNVKSHPGDYRAELHRRLTEWTFPFLFALFALVIAGDARSHRETRLHPMVSALALAFTFRWASFYVANRIENNASFVPVLYAIPIVGAAAAVFLMNRRTQMKLYTAFNERCMDLWNRASSRLFPQRDSSSGGSA
ncbi:LPS export ABC transporter permease LptF [Rhizobiaceae bacterium n13]|uniref:LPS export ABC transporter permease LptF n=1 Tax=Ferirhizobium litorale TaxID=2927786 RepID=A0AAE3QAD5_9HYPH|nr:LPS export ABC transporter permease LptF [Fererhizobium litorale]MDI7861079.1 LPS export ABC transporter permease LptF [Fererhizobium litorale]MDI7921226.1 LPS export ABC transporter permease LptF [Fererhizobium litorale]